MLTIFATANVKLKPSHALWWRNPYDFRSFWKPYWINKQNITVAVHMVTEIFWSRWLNKILLCNIYMTNKLYQNLCVHDTVTVSNALFQMWWLYNITIIITNFNNIEWPHHWLMQNGIKILNSGSFLLSQL